MDGDLQVHSNGVDVAATVTEATIETDALGGGYEIVNGIGENEKNGKNGDSAVVDEAPIIKVESVESREPTRSTSVKHAGKKKAGSGLVAKKAILKVEKMQNGVSPEAVTTQKHRLTYSLSFPAKGKVMAANSRKGNAVTKPKVDAKILESKGVTTAAQVMPKQALAVNAPANRRSLHGKNQPVDTNANGTSLKIVQSNEDKATPLESTEKNEDAHSTASSANTPNSASNQRNSVATFSFRLEERAEKRKEFFQKLEEKTHAKELEKNDMQAKSKESQEAEIKMLRKSLNFKATPMPSFYKEPGPPKAELKKIPPTRPRSPKLGRHKSSSVATTADAISVGCISCGSPQAAENAAKPSEAVADNSVDLLTRKTSQKSIAKLPSQASAAKPEPRSTVTKPKSAGARPRASRAKVQPPQEGVSNGSTNPAELRGVSIVGDSDSSEMPIPVPMSSEVSVQG